jgi:hypothetical protein
LSQQFVVRQRDSFIRAIMIANGYSLGEIIIAASALTIAFPARVSMMTLKN